MNRLRSKVSLPCYTSQCGGDWPLHTQAKQDGLGMRNIRGPLTQTSQRSLTWPCVKLYWDQLSYDHYAKGSDRDPWPSDSFLHPKTSLGQSTGLVVSVTAPTAKMVETAHKENWSKAASLVLLVIAQKCWQIIFLSFCQELGGLMVEVSLATVLQVSMM